MQREHDIVAFVQPFVPAYRRGLFDAIHAGLRDEGLRFEVWHAEPTGRVALRGNAINGEWSRPIRQYRITIRGRSLTYRPIVRQARATAAVVAGLASTNLETYLMALDPKVNLMLWGQGRNFTARNLALDAKLEKALCGKARHVFTYTEAGRSHLIAGGMDRAKVSTVRNTTDSDRLRAAKAEAGQHSDETRHKLALEDTQVGLFVGALDVPKRIPFLFEAADRIHAANSSFRLLIAGDGPLASYVADEVARRPWSRALGQLGTDDLARLSNVVDLILMPGRVGLVAVDALALGIPLVTTDFPFHAPEADYLTDLTSLRTANDPASFAAGVLRLLGSPETVRSMRSAATLDGEQFSADNSARVFVDGILDGIGAR